MVEVLERTELKLLPHFLLVVPVYSDSRLVFVWIVPGCHAENCQADTVPESLCRFEEVCRVAACLGAVDTVSLCLAFIIDENNRILVVVGNTFNEFEPGSLPVLPILDPIILLRLTFRDINPPFNDISHFELIAFKGRLRRQTDLAFMEKEW